MFHQKGKLCVFQSYCSVLLATLLLGSWLFPIYEANLQSFFSVCVNVTDGNDAES